MVFRKKWFKNKNQYKSFLEKKERITMLFLFKNKFGLNFYNSRLEQTCSLKERTSE